MPLDTLATGSQQDVRALRALAHPLRLNLLRIAARDGIVTSTSASELTGESTANCSFHLRLLAKYGFLEEAVEAVGGRGGRERPWRVAARQPLAELWLEFAHADWAESAAQESELMRRQLRIFDPDELKVAA